MLCLDLRRHNSQDPKIKQNSSYLSGYLQYHSSHKIQDVYPHCPCILQSSIKKSEILQEKIEMFSSEKRREREKHISSDSRIYSTHRRRLLAFRMAAFRQQRRSCPLGIPIILCARLFAIYRPYW